MSSNDVLWDLTVLNVNAKSPAAILKLQATALQRETRGLLEAEIDSKVNPKGGEMITFDVVAPFARNRRVELLRVYQPKNMVYPATVIADELEFNGFNGVEYPEAETENHFSELVKQVLQSNRTRSVLQSLIILSNEEVDKSVIAAETDSIDLDDPDCE